MTIDLRLGDCLEILPTLADKSVDAVITDPPYGIGENSKKNASRRNLAISKFTIKKNTGTLSLLFRRRVYTLIRS